MPKPGCESSGRQRCCVCLSPTHAARVPLPAVSTPGASAAESHDDLGPWTPATEPQIHRRGLWGGSAALCLPPKGLAEMSPRVLAVWMACDSQCQWLCP